MTCIIKEVWQKYTEFLVIIGANEIAFFVLLNTKCLHV